MDFIFVTETWLTSAVTNSELSFNSYSNVYRRDRPTRGGGVCILARKSFSVIEVALPTDCESIAIDVLSSGDRSRFLCTYVTNS